MYFAGFLCFLLTGVSAVPAHSHLSHSHLHKRTLTPDNTCGGAHGYICNPSDSYGGACCSASGWCGNSQAYCGTGCQSAFGKCSSSKSGSSPASPKPPKPSPATESAQSPSSSAQPSTAPQQPSYEPANSGSSSQPTKEGCMWNVNGAGSFTHSQTFDFSQLSSFPHDDLAISTYTIQSSPYHQIYTTGNVAVGDESLQLKVPGGQSSSPISGAEVSTQANDILYGSVRTFIKASTVPGTCHGAFFYKDDNQEVDIEVITGDKWKGVHYTNQKVNAGAEPSTIQMVLPEDACEKYREYRTDWLPGRTDFYLDGKLQKSLTSNVPTDPGSWLWNNWSDGNTGWTGAPPLEDNVMEIAKIEMYYNRTSSAGSCA